MWKYHWLQVTVTIGTIIVMVFVSSCSRKPLDGRIPMDVLIFAYLTMHRTRHSVKLERSDFIHISSKLYIFRFVVLAMSAPGRVKFHNARSRNVC